jgi:hypothetical protein
MGLFITLTISPSNAIFDLKNLVCAGKPWVIVVADFPGLPHEQGYGKVRNHPKAS